MNALPWLGGKKQTTSSMALAHCFLIVAIAFYLVVAPIQADYSTLFSWTPKYVFGQQNFSSDVFDPSPTISTFNNVYSLCICAGKVFVADYSNSRVLGFPSVPSSEVSNPSVVLFAEDFVTLGQYENYTGIYPSVIRCSENNQLFLATNGAIPTHLSRLQSPFTAGTPNLRSLEIETGAPLGIGVDDINDCIYISDTVNNRVIKYGGLHGNSTGLGVPLALYGQLYWNETEPNQGAGSALADSLYEPAGLKVDCYGGLWVTDFGNNRVLHYPYNSSVADLILGQSSPTTSTPSSAENGFSAPTAVEMDKDCSVLWVSDYNNNRIMQYRAPFITGMNAEAVLGANTTNEPGVSETSSSTFQSVIDLAYDSTTRILWIADYNSYRIIGGLVNVNLTAAPADTSNSKSTDSSSHDHNQSGDRSSHASSEERSSNGDSHAVGGDGEGAGGAAMRAESALMQVARLCLKIWCF